MATPRKKPQDKLKVGRPTIYTEELGEKICRALETSARGLHWHCQNTPGFPATETVIDWLRHNTYPKFSVRYARGREAQGDFLSDELINVTYDAQPDKFGRVEKEKLMADAIKWKASVLRPKIYGVDPGRFLNTEDYKAQKESKETVAERVARIIGLTKKKEKVNDEKK